MVLRDQFLGDPAATAHSNSSVAVLIVTFNSQQDLLQNLRCLDNQTRTPDVVLVVDCASSDQAYLNEVSAKTWKFKLSINTQKQNLGYAGGNNIGLKQLVNDKFDYVLLLNPDAYLVDQNCIQHLLSATGAFTQPFMAAPLLKHFDRLRAEVTDIIDSAGLGQTWWGRWFDRFQGRLLQSRNCVGVEEVQGLCGAALLMPSSLIHWLNSQRQQVFDASFFMYKEDIELSCYLHQAGIKQYLLWDVTAAHCRGWKKNRNEVPNWARMLSARNDVAVARRYRYLSLPFALVKLAMVRLFDI